MELRDQLIQCNHELFQKLNERKNLVSKIQKLKNNSHEYYLWDIEREIVLFQDFVDKFPMELNFDAIYSVIIEQQAIDKNDYPRWSECEHLESLGKESYCRINPVLLYFRNPKFFDELELKPFFEKKLRKYLK